MLLKSKSRRAPRSEAARAALGPLEPVRAQPVGVDPLLPVDGLRAGRGERTRGRSTGTQGSQLRRRSRSRPPGSATAGWAGAGDPPRAAVLQPCRSLMLHSERVRATRRPRATGSMRGNRRGGARGPRAAQTAVRARVRDDGRPAAPGAHGARPEPPRTLAERLGVSPSLISQVETGRAKPSVNTLYALASELGISLDELLFMDTEPAVGDRHRRGSTRSDAARRTPFCRTIRCSVLRPRSTIRLGSGVVWERLTTESIRNVDFLYVTYEVGGESSPADAFQRHSGQEWGYVLSGTLKVRIGFDEFTCSSRATPITLRLGDAPPPVQRRRRSRPRRSGSCTAGAPRTSPGADLGPRRVRPAGDQRLGTAL